MNSQKNYDSDEEYEKKRQASIKKMINSRCVCCGFKCKDVGDYTLGESYQNKWYCFEHTETLFKMLNVSNTSEFWDATGRYR